MLLQATKGLFRPTQARWKRPLSTAAWQTTIGLELHVRLKGGIKLLSSAKAPFDAVPNSHVAPFDAALPGALPILSKGAAKLAVLACLALKCEINTRSTFDRKHYFYTDLPSGFQVTQKYSPIASNGSVHIAGKRIGIQQVQLEQDTAKSFHDPRLELTLIDLNRAGAALVEIVTEPDISSAKEAAAFVREVQSRLKWVGAADANMDKGELRCDVNVSVAPAGAGDAARGNRCEIKNLNSIRSLSDAIDVESARQIALLEAGEEVAQETRYFDPVDGRTFFLRSKADAPDYRYMPDPELGPIILDPAQLERLAKVLPELPEDAVARLQGKPYLLTERDARIVVGLGEADEGVRWFEALANGRDPKIAANWLIHELLGQIAGRDMVFGECEVTPAQLGEVVDAVMGKKVTATLAKEVLATLVADTSQSAAALLAKHASATPSSGDMEALCRDVLDASPAEVDRFLSGHRQVLKRLVGLAMKQSKGRADARALNETLERLLSERQG